MKGLLELQLPLIVEARRRKQESGDYSHDSSPVLTPFRVPPTPPSSNTASPITPTFSSRNHLRYPSSSSSSLASSPPMRESLDGFMSAKRPLTEVKEEGTESHDDDSPRRPAEIDYHRAFDYFETPTEESRREVSNGPLDYDLTDELSHSIELSPTPSAKRQNEETTILVGMTPRFGTRFPSFSRKLIGRRMVRSPSVADSFLPESPSLRSRANSRAPSLIDTNIDVNDRSANQNPPTPARSVHREVRESPCASQSSFHDGLTLSVDDNNGDSEKLATTPLLPPMMVDIPHKAVEAPFQSPLQSPSIAESPSVMHTPITGQTFFGLPSPPLSTKPSMISLHHRQYLPNSETAGSPLPPTADIPSLQLTDQPDEWCTKLGHANFAIFPEPYMPEVFDLASCRQLRTDWFAAKGQFARHLSRTSDLYSTTSKIHHLTQDKWSQIDEHWKRNYIETVTRSQSGNPSALSEETFDVGPAPSTELPSLNGPKSEGKFPKLGDEGIVGPMVREKALTPQKRGRKRNFWKFLQGVFDGSVPFGRGEKAPL